MKDWRIILFGAFFTLGISWVIYSEIKYHYLIAYDGLVLENQRVPPKNLTSLVIEGSDELFPLWKWQGIDNDSFKLGDSISKKKYESEAHYFRKVNNGKYIETKLRYWTQ